jgi:WD40 repeat protein
MYVYIYIYVLSGMDVCARKPIFVTVGKDNTIRLWNVQTHQLELMKEFGEEMFSVALHPTVNICVYIYVYIYVYVCTKMNVYIYVLKV